MNRKETECKGEDDKWDGEKTTTKQPKRGLN